MTDDEIRKFDQLLMSIARHKNRKLVQLDPKDDGLVMIIPVGDVLAKFRIFTNYIRSKKNTSK